MLLSDNSITFAHPRPIKHILFHLMGHGPLIIGIMHYVDVILPVPLDSTFTYTIDDAQALR